MLEKNFGSKELSVGDFELELGEIKRLYEVDDHNEYFESNAGMILTSGGGGFLTILCC